MSLGMNARQGVAKCVVQPSGGSPRITATSRANGPGSEGSILDIKCLAEQNGGLYITAETQEEIAEAFERTLGCPMVSESRVVR
jgi:hypothetical protein